jgi:hypothetical protein
MAIAGSCGVVSDEGRPALGARGQRRGQQKENEKKPVQRKNGKSPRNEVDQRV